MSPLLLDAARVGRVKRFAIVDDAYDLPRGGEISENAFNKFVQTVESDAVIRAAIEAGSGLSDDDVEDHEGFAGNETLLEKLWKLHSEATEHELDGQTKAALRALFVDVETDRESKLALLRPLEQLLLTIGKPIMKLGSLAEPQEAAKADVVFLDLYLSTEVPSKLTEYSAIPRSVMDRARTRAVDFLKNVRQVAEADPTAITPAVILISSIGTQTVSQNFRKLSRQAMARFRFVQKQALAEGQPHSLLAIADIFRTCFASGVIEPIHRSWPNVLQESGLWVEELLLEMDIADFGRLYRLRLKKEGQPVDEYFKELIAGAVAERIAYAFHQLQLPQAADPFAEVPNFFEAPSDGFAQLFSANRITQAPGYRGPTSLDPQSGDIYLEGPLSKKKTGRLIGRKVYAVMSPPCDLIDRTGGGPAAQSVLLLEGKVRAITNESDPQILQIGKQFYELDWSWKHPQSITIDVIRKQKKSKRKVWLGRLKGEHFLDIQSHYLGSLGRIGLMKSPAVFEPLAGAISIQSGKATVELATFAGNRHFAFLSASSHEALVKQPLFFSGMFLEFFWELLTKTRDVGNRPAAVKDKAKGLLERMDRLVGMVEVKTIANHSIQNYLSIELHENENQQVAEIGSNMVIRLWKD
jgi:hypothetical protein